MIFWNHEALKRSGLEVNEGGSLVLLSSTEEPLTHTVPGSPLVHLVFPAAVHIQRYAEQAKALGY
jgi:hypothetical protein